MKSAIIIGTGPSLAPAIPTIKALQQQGFLLFGLNNTFQHFQLDCWLACDPSWHEYHGKISLPYTDQWHWDKGICNEYGYRYVEGGWIVGGKFYPRDQYEHAPGPCGGLWMQDRIRISLNHGSAPQLINLACNQYACDKVLLVGHDFTDSGKRHYFNDLSDIPGEYPEPLRKWSKFDKGEQHDMLDIYRSIAEQDGLPPIINCTPGSKLPWFPFGNLEDYLD